MKAAFVGEMLIVYKWKANNLVQDADDSFYLLK